jgi:hypothetical protein
VSRVPGHPHDGTEPRSDTFAKWPDAMREELGRRLLLAHLEMNQWVLRRVEKVAFERDRRMYRGRDQLSGGTTPAFCSQPSQSPLCHISTGCPSRQCVMWVPVASVP